MIEVNKDQCKKIAKTLESVLLPKRFFDKPQLEDDLLMHIALVLVLLCHNTKGGKFRGILNGRDKKGMEYLLLVLTDRATEDPDSISLESLEKMTGPKLTKFLSDALGKAPTADDMPRRAKILKENAKALKELGGIQAFKDTDYSVLNLLEILKKLPGFQDPLRKKAFVLMGILNEWNIWRIPDPHLIGFSIDYHIIRGAFRTGIVEIKDDKLRERILNKEEVTEKENNQIRKKIFAACTYIAGYSGQQSYELGTYLWNLFRTCCPRDEEPCCRACTRPSGCKLCRTYPFEEKLSCKFVGICKGAKDDAYKNLTETVIETEHY